jgi:hypothetical protein
LPQFVIEREFPGAGLLFESGDPEISLQSWQVLDAMDRKFNCCSYVTEDKGYYVYHAPDEQSIREHGRKSGSSKRLFPTASCYCRLPTGRASAR